ncbi:hypothetical protein DDV21_006075 [Streptococcus chenjunshii]|uniref:Uncharacterized protein n=1 Tax=Streptococcus chenjunshii TaxID=2173853 RepID=A0A372KQ55_9STRE|nr:hypothetical protein [Streptococcus chenjunshii]AXQ78674.1 hypothetical protein DDV21_006075 [Streptococcus chenjunshii]RFU51733.1 hypothetical protein DDV22_02465 [Streptococcus chenjunshii]RFU54054.1 hypothetical protein DDV23_00525 [Streptococcus chenjunshii]
MFYFLILFSICIFGFAAYFTIKLRFKKHLVLPLLAGLFLLLAFGLYKGFDRSSRNSTESKQENTTASTLKYAENSNFSWDKEKFDNLTVGDQDSGLGGMSYDDIIAEYGEPSTAFESTTNGITTRFISYQTSVNKENVSVSLRFISQPDSSWLLSYKFAENLD